MHDPIYLVAHRGDMTRFPENSLLALENALKLGACYIEFDLQMNRDKDFIVIHDDNFLRTAGIDRSVLQSSTQDLSSISVHEPFKYQQQFFPQPVSLLEDILAILAKYPAAKAFVELKEESLKYWSTEHVINALLKKLQPETDNCILISFDFDVLNYAQKRTQLPLGWVLKKYNKQHLLKARQLQPDYLICNHRKIPNKEIPWEGSWEWILYDIVDADKAIKYAQQGIHYIETADITSMMQSLPTAKRCTHE